MTDQLGRRAFLSGVAASGLLTGVAPVLGAATGAHECKSEAGDLKPSSALFVPSTQDSDAAVFAEARKHFLIPKGVAYCNTGTLGASPREVVDALVNGTRALESRLADWPYEHPEGEPLTGYQPSLEIR